MDIHIVSAFQEIRLEGENIVLQKARYEDWKDMLQNLWKYPESARYMLWEPTLTEAEARMRINRTIEFQKKEKYSFFVYEKESMKAIGFAGMKEIAPGVFEEMGIAIGPAYTGKGYGKQVCMALLKEAFEGCGASKFVATCRVQNVISHRLQMDCGFEFSHSEERVDPRDQTPYTLEFNQITREKYKQETSKVL